MHSWTFENFGDCKIFLLYFYLWDCNHRTIPGWNIYDRSCCHRFCHFNWMSAVINRGVLMALIILHNLIYKRGDTPMGHDLHRFIFVENVLQSWWKNEEQFSFSIKIFADCISITCDWIGGGNDKRIKLFFISWYASAKVDWDVLDIWIRKAISTSNKQLVANFLITNIQSLSLLVSVRSSDDGCITGQEHVKGGEFPRSYYWCTYPNTESKKKT